MSRIAVMTGDASALGPPNRDTRPHQHQAPYRDVLTHDLRDPRLEYQFRNRSTIQQGLKVGQASRGCRSSFRIWTLRGQVNMCSLCTKGDHGGHSMTTARLELETTAGRTRGGNGARTQ